MATVIDSLGTWEQLGTVTPDNLWRLFPVTTISEVFRITTTILSAEDWEKKFRSAGYIRFYYPDNNKSENTYIRVNDGEPIIKEILIPQKLKDEGLILRDVGVIFSHPKKNKYSLASFARWSMKLEGLI